MYLMIFKSLLLCWLTRGIMEWTKEMSLFSRVFMYLTMRVSEWWELNTGCVRYGDVRRNPDWRILPSFMSQPLTIWNTACLSLIIWNHYLSVTFIEWGTHITRALGFFLSRNTVIMMARWYLATTSLNFQIFTVYLTWHTWPSKSSVTGI